jgi:hypothetical protein
VTASGVFGAAFSIAVWISVVVYHEGAPLHRLRLDGRGITLYVSTGAARASRSASLHDPGRGPPGGHGRAEYGSILVPVFGEDFDDDIIGTAGRLAASEGEEEEGGRGAWRPCTCSRSRCRLPMTRACPRSA